MTIRRCAWHEKYFGGEKAPYSDLSITDGLCLRCEAIVMLDIEVCRMERETIRLKEVNYGKEV